MKKTILCILSMFFAFTGAAFVRPVAAVRADAVRVQLQRESGDIFGGRGKDRAVLSAVKSGDIYYDDIRISLFGRGRKEEIVPAADGGYSPHIQLVSFDGERDQIFYGADSGGSGGYGYYFAYSAGDTGVTEIFDSQTFVVPYEAEYIDGYKVEVKNTETGAVTLIDISDRGEEYLSQIYRNGKLIEPRACDIFGVNSVSPFYNNAQGRYGLEVYARITGLYAADAIGYIIMRLGYEKGVFRSFFDMVGVFAGI